MIRLLLENGADPTIIDERLKQNALMFFSSYSSPEGVREILRKSIHLDVNEQDGEGNTALHLACKQNNEAISRLLLNHGADPNLLNGLSGQEAQDRNTPLQVAIKNHAVECVYLLLDSPKLDLKFSQSLLEESVALDEPKIVLKILEKHDPTYTMQGSILLHKVVRSDAYSDEEFTKAVRIFGKKCIEYEDCKGRTLLMVAAMLNKHKKLYILQKTYLSILIENFFYPDWKECEHVYCNLIAKQDQHGDSAVHLAVKYDGLDADFEQTVKVLDQLRTNESVCKVPALKEEKDRDIDPLTLCDKHGLTGMHLAIETGKVERAITLLKVARGRGSEVVDRKSSTIVHYAIKRRISAVDFEKLLKLLKQFKPASTLFTILKTKNVLEKTALHMALDAKLSQHPEHLIELKQTQDTPVSVGRCQEVEADPTPILRPALARQSLNMKLKANRGQLLCGALKYVSGPPESSVPAEPEDVEDEDFDSFINARDGSNKNALQIAIENGCPSDLITKLMECRSDVHGHAPHSHVPIDENIQLSNVKAVLENERGDLTKTSDHGVSLLEAAIKAKRPDIIKFLLVKKAKVSHRHLKQVICDHENEEFAKILVRHADSAEDIVKELNRFEEKSGVVFFHELIRKMPDVAEEALYRNAEIEDTENGPEMIDRYYLLRDSYVNSNQIQLRSFDVENALEVMVEQERLTLLQHPVVHEFIKSKWDNFGLPLYSLQLILYFFFIIPLSALALLPTSLSATTCESIFGITSTTSNSSANSCYDIVSYGLAAATMTMTIIHLAIPSILSIIQLSQSKHIKLNDLFFPLKSKADTYFQITVFNSAFLFALLTIINTSTGCCIRWQWHIGLFAIIQGWTNLIRLFSKFPFVGEHAITFATIVWTFLKIAVFAVLLILSSTIVLTMLFFDEEALQSPFFGFGRGFVTVLTMVTGELDYQDAFGLSYDAAEENVVGRSNNVAVYPETANFVWVVFLVLVPILLTNMLTGLAVGDVIELHKHAALTKLQQKVKLVTHAEDYFCVRSGHCVKIRHNWCIMRLLQCFRKSWNGGKAMNRDDVKITSYAKNREEERKDILAQSSGGESTKDTRILESIDNIKNVALSCEKKIREFKDVYDDTINKLKMENIKIRRDNEQLLSEIRRIQQTVANH